MTGEALSIVVADDHGVVRAGVRMLLEAVPGWNVVAECADADAAARTVHERHPDVLVLDLLMPGRSSMDVLSELHRTEPGTHVVMLTMSEDPSIARAAIESGCDAYVLKDSSDTDLVEAIRRAVAGASYLDPTIGALVASSRPAAAAGKLTERELDVLGLIAVGNTNVEIARALAISVRTVETHRARIQRKTGSKTRAELVAYAARAGLLDSLLRGPHDRATPIPTEV